MSDERDQDTAMTGELARANSYAAELETLRARVEELTGWLAECYRLSGADTDGNEDWRIAPHAVAEVRRLRVDADGTDRELYEAESRLRAVSEAIEEKLERVNYDDVHGEYKAILGDYVRFEDHDALISGLRAIVEGK